MNHVYACINQNPCGSTKEYITRIPYLNYVSGGVVHPGSFPEGFCGYYAVQQDDRLYVGFRFSAVFGFFETGDFDVTIPVEGEISEVIVKTRTDERTVWKKWNRMVFISQQSVTVCILYRW